jgi:endonuclease-3
VHEIEPFVLTEGPVSVGFGDFMEKVRYLGDIGLAHASFDLDMMHFGSRYRARPVVGFATLQGVARPRSLRGRALMVAARLADEYPGSATELCALRHDGPFQLLAATILSAQSTDERVNMVTPALFAAFPTAESLAPAPPEAVEELIHSTGFFRAKTRSLLGMAQAVVARGGQVPSDMEELTRLPGVGRKTANVVRSVAFGLPGLPVDTHVGRIVRRLGLTAQTDPVKVESEVCALLPEEEWGTFSLRLILHGRRVCLARRPRCEDCLVADICPSAEIPIRPGRSGTGRKSPPVK